MICQRRIIKRFSLSFTSAERQMTDQDIVEKFINVYKSIVAMKRSVQRDDDGGEGWRKVINDIYRPKGC
jgi:hypothetical protein